MNESVPSVIGPLPTTLARRVDETCNRFEVAWRTGPRPRIEDFLGGWLEPERAALVRELLALEVFYRRGSGEDCRAEEYQARFPDLDPGWLARVVAAHADALSSHPTSTSGFAETLPVVPGYEILAELGRGGMGVVYKARQPAPLNREVALKTLLEGAQAGVEELERFRREAEALARMQHPNIVQIYEVGEHCGRPYFALELVEGGNLAQKLAVAPLPPREAAWLMETLARAVHAAHQRQVLHRDLKPSNVLLTADGTPKISDFGLAKRLDVDTHLTESGALVGTIAYMAPEQAAGRTREVSPATDVYALGVILYEALTGRLPFKGENVLETLLQISEQDPVPPRRLRPSVPFDLETICLKCLEKQPARRYASAEALAEDLRRELAGEPIVARPIGPVGRAVKWAKRRPAAAGLLATLILLVAGGLTSVALILFEQAERLEAQQKRDDYFQRVARNVDIIENEGKHLSEIENMLARQPGMARLRRRVLEHRLKFYQGLIEEDSTDPEVLLMTARATLQLGRTHQSLGQQDKAEAAYRQAITHCTWLVEKFPDNLLHPFNLAQACNHLGKLQLAARKPEAGALFDRALELNQKLVAQREDANGAYRNALAETHLNQARFLYWAGKPRQAEEKARTALGSWQELIKDSTEADFRHGLAQAHGLLSLLTPQPEQRVAEAGRAAKLYQELVHQHPEAIDYRLELIGQWNDLGAFLDANGRPVEAEGIYRSALPVQKRLLDDFPAVPDYLSHAASLHHNLAIVLLERHLAYRLAQAGLGGLCPQAFVGLSVLSSLGRAALPEACGHCEQAVRYQQEAQGRDRQEARDLRRPENPKYRKWLENHHGLWASLLTELGEYARAAEVTAAQARDLVADPALAAAEQQRLRQEYGDAVMQLLRRAAERGHCDPGHLKKEFEWLLGSRDDFKQFRKNLEEQDAALRVMPPIREGH